MNTTNFQEQKIRQLARKDKSDEGKLDKSISSLCNKINKNPEYYTTSSCSGRIILIKSKETKQPDLFIFKSHNKIILANLKKVLNNIKTSSLIYFKQEPCILHVAARNMETAQILLDKAKFAGFKRSGIIASRKRIILELMSTEHLEFPIVINKKILADNNFLKIITKEANKKLKRTWKKIKNLENLL